MKISFKFLKSLMDVVREDLGRPHPYAAERIGFISAGMCTEDTDLMFLARDYMTVPDEQYIRSRNVGAMIGPEAISRALQWAMSGRNAIFHVHQHGGSGIPNFSGIDLHENARLAPDFFKVLPQLGHGAIVLSANRARGNVWSGKNAAPLEIGEFVEVGSPVNKWIPI